MQPPIPVCPIPVREESPTRVRTSPGRLNCQGTPAQLTSSTQSPQDAAPKGHRHTLHRSPGHACQALAVLSVRQRRRNLGAECMQVSSPLKPGALPRSTYGAEDSQRLVSDVTRRFNCVLERIRGRFHAASVSRTCTSRERRRAGSQTHIPFFLASLFSWDLIHTICAPG